MGVVDSGRSRGTFKELSRKYMTVQKMFDNQLIYNFVLFTQLIIFLLFAQDPYVSYKLSSDVFRGGITCLGYLPLNRLLLIGSDTGNIVLCS